MKTDRAWTANEEVVERLTKRRTPFNYDEAKVPTYTLPNPLSAPGIDMADSPTAWQKTVRPALLELFREQVYGIRPTEPYRLGVEVKKTIDDAFEGQAIGKALEFVIQINQDEFRFPVTLFVPRNATAAAPVPAVVFINNRSFIGLEESVDSDKPLFWPARQIIQRGYATASFHTSHVDPDDASRYAQGIRSFFAAGKPPTRTSWRSLSAWGWAASRVLDHLETIDSVDAKKACVVGHSRGGKTSLWAAAEDTRFAIAYSNNSGCGGAALSRRRLGETVGRITTSFPHWFNENFAEYADREEDLPIDQHQLIGLIAPRGVYVTSADEDLWADPRGEYLSVVNAAPVFTLLGQKSIRSMTMPALEQPRVVGSTGYHVRSGRHGLLLSDWQHFLDFADGLLSP